MKSPTETVTLSIFFLLFFGSCKNFLPNFTVIFIFFSFFFFFFFFFPSTPIPETDVACATLYQVDMSTFSSFSSLQKTFLKKPKTPSFLS